MSVVQFSIPPDEVWIETERLLIRTLRPGDVSDRYVGWLNDPDVTRYLECRHRSWDIADAREYVATVNGWMVGLFVPSVGHIGNMHVSAPLARHPTSEISIMIGHSEARGKGLGPEAIRALTGWIFASTGILKLWAGMYAGNVASQRAFRKAGYRWEARHVGHYLFEGRMADVVEYGANAPD